MRALFVAALAIPVFAASTVRSQNASLPVETTVAAPGDSFRWQTDQFADVRILRYQVPGWEQLSVKEKKLAYYLTMAGLAGRDIMWDQNYKHNLAIRRALEKIIRGYKSDKTSPEWGHFMEYAKEVFFSNGIHHHYGMDKFIPSFKRAWFEATLTSVGGKLDKAVLDAMFDPAIDAKKVSLDAAKDLQLSSAVNFYADDVSEKEVEAFYAAMKQPKPEEPLSYGLNSQLVKHDGVLAERVWKVDGLYGPALTVVNENLAHAMEFACNDQQKKAIALLMDYFRTGDLKTWDDFNIAWVKDTTSTVDFILGFIEVYNDPMGKRGSFESCVEVTDPVATRNMRVIQENAQWFEDNSPLLPQHKKKKVVGVTYKFVNTAGEAGDAAPSTPIGVNLPNANWIRKIGSKSVSLGNISDAYEKSGGKSALEAFCNDQEEIDRAMEYGSLAGKLHTALHEVIGHASGQLEPGVGQPDATLKNYKSTVEEGRADLVALYYMMDPKLVEIGVMPSLEVGKAEYDAYIRNGLLAQLRRLKPGKDIEEAHMRNRHWVSAWVVEKGLKDGVVAVNSKGNGPTTYDIKDYEKLRILFGGLLREVQRITSQGDYEAGKALVETYGVKVDPALHAYVLERAKMIATAPYAGFIQPRLVPVKDASGNITDIRVEYPDDFIGQMLEYGSEHSFLPDKN
jgi:dipeptidyl-peptidase-3